MSAMAPGGRGCPGFMRPVAAAITRWSWCGPTACARWSRPRLTRQCRAGCVASMGRSAVSANGASSTRYSAEVQQHPLTTASEHGRWHTELAGTTDKRPGAPLVRDEEAKDPAAFEGSDAYEDMAASACAVLRSAVAFKCSSVMELAVRSASVRSRAARSGSVVPASRPSPWLPVSAASRACQGRQDPLPAPRDRRTLRAAPCLPRVPERLKASCASPLRGADP